MRIKQKANLPPNISTSGKWKTTHPTMEDVNYWMMRKNEREACVCVRGKRRKIVKTQSVELRTHYD